MTRTCRRRENLWARSCGRSITLDARHVQALRGELDQLRAEVAELRASRERLVVAADDDRRRIERELHQGVRQHLVALAVNLQRVGLWLDGDPAAARELIGEMERDVQQALDDMAGLAERIYPPLLDARGLGAALRAASLRAGIPASIDVRVGADCPPGVAATVYRCFLESLEHVGQGGRPTVAVREEEGALEFEVVEDGARFEMVGGPDPWLDRLRDRVEALGGRLTIRTQGPGIAVSGSIPLSR